MKVIKIIAFIAFISAILAIRSSIGTYYSSVQRTAAIESVNGGEAEFIIQQQSEKAEGKIMFFANIVVIAIFTSTAMWMFKPNKKQKKKNK